MSDLNTLRSTIRSLSFAAESDVLNHAEPLFPPVAERQAIEVRAAGFVDHLRKDARPALMELFLGEFGLNTEEGVALMCLAEALLRVPDVETIDALIEDKIAPSDWSRHLGAAHSPMVNASTWALFLTGKVLEDPAPVAGVLRGAIRRLGEPVIRRAVAMAMKEMGRQFVLGETIERAMERAKTQELAGQTYSYDMLGEAARTEADAVRYARAYAHAIEAMAGAKGADIRTRPGISVKLSALYPRYEPLQKEAVLQNLVPRVRALARSAAAANVGFNIDAEEAERLDLSLDVIQATLADPELAGWDGFGVVVQAYSKRALGVIDWLYALASEQDRRIMVRLVKGAYWDTEIKHAQVFALPSYPVFTRKAATDAHYLACARRLMDLRARIYPQFATHNAHTISAVLNMNVDPEAYEFQRLHGMGVALHDHVRAKHATACRIYAPVGAHRDLLAYLVRRLLENGANSSFVNQIVDRAVPVADIVRDPIVALEHTVPLLPEPHALFAPRSNSRGLDWADPEVLAELSAELAHFETHHWDMKHAVGSQAVAVLDPSTGASVGTAYWASAQEASAALSRVSLWTAPPQERRAALERAAEMLEAQRVELTALLMREAGKTLIDCVNEIREAVDFLRYYARQASEGAGLGVVTCISPWNFPLAIFMGQVSAALAAGCGVIAKPAEQTSLIADVAVGILRAAGVPYDALLLVAGAGAEVGPVLTGTKQINAVAFTGSTVTAQAINRAMAQHAAPGTPLIAETGGLNAMVVDSTALLEQAVGDIVTSAFQSAGQRCSALRMLYVQEEVAEPLIAMLKGAMDALVVGNAADLATDVGPVIDARAKAKIDAHIAAGKVLHQTTGAGPNHVPPTLMEVQSINDLQEEVFGPVCHIATFKSKALPGVIRAINATGYGLTFGFHSRIDGRVAQLCDTVTAGNIYINRNQIGAVVGSQPFGGHGLSGTGPKAGGPRYVARFQAAAGGLPDVGTRDVLPGPTGESNEYRVMARGRIGCFGPSEQDFTAQRAAVAAIGADAVDGRGMAAADIQALEIEAAVYWGDEGRDLAQALAASNGPIRPLLTTRDFAQWCVTERVISIDTTASGGNADLLAGIAQDEDRAVTA